MYVVNALGKPLDPGKLELTKNCDFADERKIFEKRLFVCLLVPPLLGSGVQCPFVMESGEEIPVECPNKK